MLRTLPEHPDAATASTPHPGATWIDLNGANAEEVRLVEQMTGLHVPTQDELAAIETSSRLRREHGALYLSTPVVRHDPDGAASASSLGFVLCKERLISVRFMELPAFETVAAEWRQPDQPRPGCGPDVLVNLLSASIDRIADVMERLAGELDQSSHQVFHADPDKAPRGKRANDALRATLRKVGQVGDYTSRLRDVLLGIGRIIPYVLANAAAWMSPETRTQFETVREDVRSLADYEQHLSGKVQFLLDATLGFINIEQNEIVKVLTLVSVVGVPPTLIASMYGMNFKNIPEYDWAWGYQYGLVLIAGSAIGSLLWFKWRGWL